MNDIPKDATHFNKVENAYYMFGGGDDDYAAVWNPHFNEWVCTMWTNPDLERNEQFTKI